MFSKGNLRETIVSIFDIVLKAIYVIDFFLLKFIIEAKEPFFWIFIWVIATVGIICVDRYFHNEINKRKLSFEKQLRYCLINMRELFTDYSQKCNDIYYRIKAQHHIELLSEFRRLIKKVKDDVTKMIFYQVSEGNINLDNVFRVALFEMDEPTDMIKIVSFYNSENVRPRIFSLNRGFPEGWGVVGNSWKCKTGVYISDIEKHTQQIKSPLYLSLFGNPQDSQFEQFIVRSIVCFPIIISATGAQIIKGVICIDCNKKNMFKMNREDEVKRLRIILYPYLRFLSFVYMLSDILEIEEQD